MAPDDRYRGYWGRARLLTVALLLVWFGAIAGLGNALARTGRQGRRVVSA